MVQSVKQWFWKAFGWVWVERQFRLIDREYELWQSVCQKRRCRMIPRSWKREMRDNVWDEYMHRCGLED